MRRNGESWILKTRWCTTRGKEGKKGSKLGDAMRDKHCGELREGHWRGRGELCDLASLEVVADDADLDLELELGLGLGLGVVLVFGV